jgi:hypothetical protein
MLNYNSHELTDGISLSYKYDVLAERGNKRYSRKEAKKAIKVVAVQVTNNTETPLTFGKDIAFFSGENQIFPLEPLATKQMLKQQVATYLPYLLLTPIKLFVSSGRSTDVYPIGYALGPGITVGNMAVAGTANSNLYNELEMYNLLGKEIQPGEVVYGIIAVRDMGYTPLSIKMLD